MTGVDNDAVNPSLISHHPPLTNKTDLRSLSLISQQTCFIFTTSQLHNFTTPPTMRSLVTLTLICMLLPKVTERKQMPTAKMCANKELCYMSKSSAVQDLTVK